MTFPSTAIFTGATFGCLFWGVILIVAVFTEGRKDRHKDAFKVLALGLVLFALGLLGVVCLIIGQPGVYDFLCDVYVCLVILFGSWLNPLIIIGLIAWVLGVVMALALTIACRTKGANPLEYSPQWAAVVILLTLAAVFIFIGGGVTWMSR